MFEICVNQINVHDMDTALEFYCKKLGYKLSEESYLPQIASLEGAGLPLILNKVNEPRKTHYGVEAQTVLNFKVNDLKATIKNLSEKGVKFLHSEAQECPVGVYAAFQDPSGNVHELVEFR